MSAPPAPEVESPKDSLGRLGAMEERCRALIRQTTDWPKEGITFLDASPLYCDAVALRACVDALAERYRTADVTHFAGVDARGFALACAVACAVGAGFVMVRKKGKLPPRVDNCGAKLLQCEYKLEYGTAALEVASDILDESGGANKVVVIDDLAGTGGTAIAAANLLRDAGAVVHEVAVLIELAGSLQPRQRIKNEAFLRSFHQLCNLCTNFFSSCHENSTSPVLQFFVAPNETLTFFKYRMASLNGDTGLPLVGETFAFLRDPVQFVETRRIRNGPIFVSNIIGAPTVFVCDYSSVRSLLCSVDGVPDAADAYAEFVGQLFPSPNVLLLPSRSPLRSRIQHLFYSAIDETTATNFRPVVTTLVQPVIEQLTITQRLTLYATFKPLCELITFSLVFGSVFAENNYAKIRTLATTHFNGIVATPVAVRAFGKRSARARAIDASDQMLDLIQCRIDFIRQHGETEEDSVIGKLVRASNGVKDDHMISKHVLLLLSAAIPKTMASTLCSLFVQLSSLSNEKDVDLRCAIVETLRLYPPLLGGMRTTGDDTDTIIDDTIIPKSHRVWWSARHANRDASVFDNAHSFVPKRWDGKLGDIEGCPFAKIMDSDMPLSFGAGERLCPGRFLAWSVIEQVASSILSRFHIVKSASNDDVEMRYVPVCRSVDDITVELRVKT